MPALIRQVFEPEFGLHLCDISWVKAKVFWRRFLTIQQKKNHR